MPPAQTLWPTLQWARDPSRALPRPPLFHSLGALPPPHDAGVSTPPAASTTGGTERCMPSVVSPLRRRQKTPPILSVERAQRSERGLAEQPVSGRRLRFAATTRQGEERKEERRAAAGTGPYVRRHSSSAPGRWERGGSGRRPKERWRWKCRWFGAVAVFESHSREGRLRSRLPSLDRGGSGAQVQTSLLSLHTSWVLSVSWRGTL